MAHENDLLPPRYTNARRIGSGGMGEIFRAEDEVLGRTVAIKVLAERYAQDKSVRARFTPVAAAVHVHELASSRSLYWNSAITNAASRRALTSSTRFSDHRLQRLSIEAQIGNHRL